MNSGRLKSTFQPLVNTQGSGEGGAKVKIHELGDAEYVHINEQNGSFSAHYVIRNTGSANSK